MFWVDAGFLDVLKIDSLFEASLEDRPEAKGPYLGQTPPGSTPRRFHPGGVSSVFMEHSPVVFSADGKELYWSPDFRDAGRPGASIYTMRRENGIWTIPRRAAFSRPFSDYNPVLSADGTMLFFASNRAYRDQDPESNDLDIWMTGRTPDGWADPVPVEIENRPGYLMTQFSLTRDGVLYFSSTEDYDAFAWDIYRAEFKDGRFINTRRLEASLNTPGWESYPFIAPDESFLVFTSMNRPDGRGGMDLYISFRNSDGSWTAPKNLGGEINTEHVEAFASLSPDEKYLFFVSDREGNVDMYWVAARCLEELRQKART